MLALLVGFGMGKEVFLVGRSIDDQQWLVFTTVASGLPRQSICGVFVTGSTKDKYSLFGGVTIGSISLLQSVVPLGMERERTCEAVPLMIGDGLLSQAFLEGGFI